MTRFLDPVTRPQLIAALIDARAHVVHLRGHRRRCRWSRLPMAVREACFSTARLEIEAMLLGRAEA